MATTTPVQPCARWRSVRVDGARVRLLDVGAGPGLLFLHGWGLSPAAYAHGLALLASSAGVRALAPCLPGFGGSDAPPRADLDLPGYAVRAGRLLDVLGVPGPVHVAGHSFGGGVALQLARERPDRVAALTLLNPVGGADGRGGAGVWLSRAAGAAAELVPGTVARSAPVVLRAFLPNLAHPLTLALTARLALSAALAPAVEAVLAAGLPVRVVWSDRDRLLAPGTLGRVAGLPQQQVPGAHGWPLDEPEAFAAVLRAALADQPAGRPAAPAVPVVPAPRRPSGRITP